MKGIRRILRSARESGHDRLSEHESKQILGAYGIPVVRETLVKELTEAKTAASRIGYPVVLKACSPEVSHKTESGLIEMDLRNEAELSAAFRRMSAKNQGHGIDFLIQEMIKGDRELVIGMTRDRQFGPCVMFGLGGIFTEALGDVSFRAAPLSQRDALEMIQEIKGNRILSDFRGMPPVDMNTLCKCLIGLGDIALGHEDIRDIDVNPLIVRISQPIAVDALIVLGR
jgi:acetyl-CoA synthetase (ADP-forming)